MAGWSVDRKPYQPTPPATSPTPSPTGTLHLSTVERAGCFGTFDRMDEPITVRDGVIL